MVSPRQDREATPTKSEQCGCLNQTCLPTTPVWTGGTSEVKHWEWGREWVTGSTERTLKYLEQPETLLSSSICWDNHKVWPQEAFPTQRSRAMPSPKTLITPLGKNFRNKKELRQGMKTNKQTKERIFFSQVLQRSRLTKLYEQRTQSFIVTWPFV